MQSTSISTTWTSSKQLDSCLFIRYTDEGNSNSGEFGLNMNFQFVNLDNLHLIFRAKPRHWITFRELWELCPTFRAEDKRKRRVERLQTLHQNQWWTKRWFNCENQLIFDLMFGKSHWNSWQRIKWISQHFIQWVFYF